MCQAPATISSIWTYISEKIDKVPAVNKAYIVMGEIERENKETSKQHNLEK